MREIHIKNILVGKYYWHRDSSHKKMHPSYVYKKNAKRNRYYHLNFTSSYGSNRRKLIKNLDNSDKDCYVLNSPQVSKRKSFAGEIQHEFKPRTYEDKNLLNYIKRKKK